MRYRELKLKPIAGAQENGATVYRVQGDGSFIAVVRGDLDERTQQNFVERIQAGGFKGVVVVADPGVEFTMCEVEDGAPVRWQEDGRPSYVDLEAKVKQLESQVAMGSGADCMPCVVTR